MNLREHCEWASKIVSTWPAWKRNLLQRTREPMTISLVDKYCALKGDFKRVRQERNEIRTERDKLKTDRNNLKAEIADLKKPEPEPEPEPKNQVNIVYSTGSLAKFNNVHGVEWSPDRSVVSLIWPERRVDFVTQQVRYVDVVKL